LASGAFKTVVFSILSFIIRNLQVAYTPRSRNAQPVGCMNMLAQREASTRPTKARHLGRRDGARCPAVQRALSEVK
jgi:hypothetical protein